MKQSRLWSNLEHQGKTFGLVDFSKKRRKKNSSREALRNLIRKKGLVSEGEQIRASFEAMLSSVFLNEETKKFLSSLRGSYTQFRRFTPKQFTTFKKIFWQMKERERQNQRPFDF